MMCADPPATAKLDPWCVVPLLDGVSVLFGFALRHPLTGGLSWTSSSEILHLDETAGRARTRSGRIYQLGRRIDVRDIPGEGDEPWIAFDLLLGHVVADPDTVPPIVTDLAADREWVSACKAVRHLALTPPRRIASDIKEFRAAQAAAYRRLRRLKGEVYDAE